MDLNYILRRHQLSLVACSTAASPEARSAHRAFAREYAQRIRNFQHALGATARLACNA